MKEPPEAEVAAKVRAKAHIPRLRLPRKYSLRKRPLPQQPVGDHGQDQDPGHVEEEGGQGAAGAHRASSWRPSSPGSPSPRSSSAMTRRLNHRAKTEAAAQGAATPQSTQPGIPATVAVSAVSP